MISRVSTYSSALEMQSLSMQQQSQLSQAAQEESSGVMADPALEMGANIGRYYQLQSEAAQQTAAQSAATTVGSRLDAMQTVLGSVATAVQSASTSAIEAAEPGNDLALGTVSTTATGSMDQILSLLNTTYEGQYLFSGSDGGTQTMASSSDAALANFSSALSSAATAKGGLLDASDVEQLVGSTGAIGSTFSDSSTDPTQNFSGTLLNATAGGPMSVSIGGGQTVSYGLTGGSSGFRDILKGLSLLSLASSSELDSTGQQQMLTEASEALSQGQSELTTSTAAVGATQTQLQSIATSQQATASATQEQFATMDSVDATSTYNKLSALQTQLQATYEITSSISKLSLTNYMS